MTSSNRSVGIWGEALASEYLSDHGYRILDRNARTAHGEIDLVALHGTVTVFIEVKTRTSKRFGPPETAITGKKRAHMLAASQAYLQVHPELDGDYRLDVIAIEYDRSNKVTSLVHFENAVNE
jgi:putative endonuclease